jgi:MFS family permease
MFFFAQAGVFAFLKTYVMATGFGTLGAFFTVYTLTAIVQRLVLGWVPDRLGLTLVLGPRLLAFIVGLLLLSVAGSMWEVWTAGFFCGVGHGHAFPTLLGLVSRRTRTPACESQRRFCLIMPDAYDRRFRHDRYWCTRRLSHLRTLCSGGDDDAGLPADV